MVQFSGVRPEKAQALLAEMSKLGLHESDMDEQFIRASGHGGQKVNKTSVCVYLKHRPTGLEVKVDSSRQQGLNRFLARRRLIELYRKEILNEVTPKDKAAEKIRKQKARRKRRHRNQNNPDESNG
jgi:protein subunit release factor B